MTLRQPLDYARDGAAHCRAALVDAQVDRLAQVFDTAVNGRAGVRIGCLVEFDELLGSSGPVAARVRAATGRAAWPVRAILFDKSAACNWAVGWHQDRTIAVRERRAVAGFYVWTVKDGAPHVEPPFAILAALTTVRIHLDVVDSNNAPLLVALGSHRLGRIVGCEMAAAVERCGIHACLAERGDIWLYATPILHASARVRSPNRRRVLQIDYAGEALPGGLAWLDLFAPRTPPPLEHHRPVA